MGKRSNFPRIPKDLYETPEAAIQPLLPAIYEIFALQQFTEYGHCGKLKYYEPCCGNCALVKHLKNYAECVGYSDDEIDARTTDYSTIINEDFDCFVTNPPWSREVLHPIIENLARQKPTWLLLDADWMHTRQSKDLINYCQKIISVGRVKWIAGSQHTSKDNCCWYLFNLKKTKRIFVEFYGRV